MPPPPPDGEGAPAGASRRAHLGGRRRRTIGAAAALVLLVALALAVRLAMAANRPATVDPHRPAVTVVIRPGAHLSGIAAQLHTAGVIASPRLFEALAVWHGVARRLQAGAYTLSPSMTPQAILGVMAAGVVAAGRVTVPEGWNAAQIVAALETSHLGGGVAAALQRAVADPTLLVAAALPAPVPGVKVALEGYLFPDTYTFAVNASPADIFGRMLARFGRAWTPQLAMAARANAGLNTAQAVTLASIVQREAGSPTDMPLIAGIYLHRLRMGMRLDADPTVLYGLGLIGQQTSLSDAQTASSSPYNTYLVAGLPPGPICNPGAAALQAVAHPASTTALYFLTKRDGRVVPADTLQQQVANEKTYLGG